MRFFPGCWLYRFVHSCFQAKLGSKHILVTKGRTSQVPAPQTQAGLKIFCVNIRVQTAKNKQKHFEKSLVLPACKQRLEFPIAIFRIASSNCTARTAAFHFLRDKLKFQSETTKEQKLNGYFKASSSTKPSKHTPPKWIFSGIPVFFSLLCFVEPPFWNGPYVLD